MAKLEISVNSNDLLALLGDDPEVSLKIRSSIIQQFTHRYLKGLVNHEIFQAVEQTIRGHVTNEVQSVIGAANWSRVDLKPALLYKVKSVVDQEVERVLRETIQEKLDVVMPELTKTLSAKIENLYRSAVGKEIEDKAKVLVSTLIVDMTRKTKGK